MLVQFGKFEGSVVTEWATPDREMRLVEDFAYVDPDGLLWAAPRNSIVDGASIPRAFWTVIGSPFTGHYRSASVVHDVACEVRTQAWERVHRMFYWACRCGGVSQLKAKIMFAAVFHFGPRWGADGALEAVMAPPSERDVAAVSRFVERSDPSLEVIEAFVRP